MYILRFKCGHMAYQKKISIWRSLLFMQRQTAVTPPTPPKKKCLIIGYQVYNPAAFVKENTFSTEQEKLFCLEKFNINKNHSSQ